MGSGFLLAIVLGLWAIVLYPTFAKKRISTNETKSIERFNRAMNSISDLVPNRKKEKFMFQRNAAIRRRNVTYLLFTLTIGIIIVSFFQVIPVYIAFVPLFFLLIWLVAAFIAAQRIISGVKKPVVANVIRKNYVIYKKPTPSKTLIKTDPERDLIMDERDYEKVVEPEIVTPKLEQEIRRAQGA
jgi:hypothetical protein